MAFERLLARLAGSGDWVLKGGFALELRYGLTNRPTRDLDLRTDAGPSEALVQLRRAITESDIVDHFSFEFGEVTQELQGAPGGGLRVRIIPRLAGLPFAPFAIDLASGDALVGEPEEMSGSDLLSFAGIEPVRFPIYPVTQHLAEKLHAYTLPRTEDNTRVKDLVDMATIAAQESVTGDGLMASVRATFAARGTHPPPDQLAAPPATWAEPYRKLARESTRAPSTELEVGHALATMFWNPALNGHVLGEVWNPTARRWLPIADVET